MIYMRGICFTEEPHLFERLANPDPEDISEFDAELFRLTRTPLAVVLTCNRAEVYSASPLPYECIERVLGLNTLKVRRYRYESDNAPLHLFLLASGVLSPKFGEDTVISQVRIGGDAARKAMVSSSELSKLFNMAVGFGKSIQSEKRDIKLDPDLISAIEEKTAGAERILIVGSGSHAREIARRLLEKGHDVSMTLRDPSKIFLIPAGAKGLPYDDRLSYVSSFDAVISSSSGIYHTFEEEDLRFFSTGLIFDLSSPPDLPPSFNAYTQDSLTGGRSDEERKHYRRVQELAEQQLEEFTGWQQCRDVFREAEDFAYSVVRRLRMPFAGCTGLTEEERKSLQDAVFETVRKAYISEVKSRRK